jgi:hypothetical protein
MLKFRVGISLEGKWRSSASTAKSSPNSYTGGPVPLAHTQALFQSCLCVA